MKDGMSMRQLAMQNQAGEQKLAEDDRNRKMSAQIEAMDYLATLPPEQRPSEFMKVQDGLIQQGVLPREQALPEYVGDQAFNNMHARLKQSPMYLERQQAAAKNRLLNAQADAAVPNAEMDRAVQRSIINKNEADAAKERKQASGKILPAGEASKIGNFLGAVDASTKIENLGGSSSLPTGKWEAAKDWIKSTFDTQDQGRAKSLADIATQRNEIMSRIAGANVTPDEKSRILEGIPTNSDAPASFAGKGQSTTDQLLGKAQSEIEALAAAGYDVTELNNKLAERRQLIASARSGRTPKQDGSGGLIQSAQANETPKVEAPNKLTRVVGGVNYVKVNGGWKRAK
jgi:hypothetical protein